MPTAEETARTLDPERLGKQRIEALTSARLVLGQTDKPGWAAHPIVDAWRPYVSWLVQVYVPANLSEWEGRGYRNERSREAWRALLPLVEDDEPLPPAWLGSDIIRSHRSYLLRRHPEWYRRLWPDQPDDLPLLWPARDHRAAAEQNRRDVRL